MCIPPSERENNAKCEHNNAKANNENPSDPFRSRIIILCVPCFMAKLCFFLVCVFAVCRQSLHGERLVHIYLCFSRERKTLSMERCVKIYIHSYVPTYYFTSQIIHCIFGLCTFVIAGRVFYQSNKSENVIKTNKILIIRIAINIGK